MSVLPKGWESATPLDAASPIRGVTYKKEQALDEPKKGYTAVLRANNIQNDKVVMDDLVYVPNENIQTRQRLNIGDIVIAMSSGSISVVGKSAQLKDEIDASFGAFCGVLRPSVEIDARYVGHFLKSDTYRNAISNMARGVNINNLKWSHFEEIEFPVAPLPEQTRIADKLDALLSRVDAVRERLDRVPVLLKQFRQAVLAAATSGQLTEDWREVHTDGDAEGELSEYLQARAASEKKPPASPDLSHWKHDVPDGWVLCSVNQFAVCLDRLRVPIKREDRRNVEGLYPYFGANGEVGRIDDYIFDDELVLVTEDETFYGREKPIAYRSSGKCWVNNHAHVLKPKGKEEADYLCFSLMYYDVTPWLTGTTGRAKLTQEAMNGLPIVVPPNEELVEIVRRVGALFALADKVQAQYEAARARVDRLTPALLAKAFRGELVPQDPSDEPAAKLLERLLTSKASEPKPVKKDRKSTPPRF